MTDLLGGCQSSPIRPHPVRGGGAAKLTSAQIAERLVLSRRTVDNHVTAILAPARRFRPPGGGPVAVEAGWLGSELSEPPMGVSG